MSEAIAELRTLSEEKLIANHGSVAQHTQVSTNHYLQELYRRDQERVAKAMLTYTRRITALTIIVTVATVIAMLATVGSIAIVYIR